jgi:5-methylcytosine-specific restriction endonuclease McrA
VYKSSNKKNARVTRCIKCEKIYDKNRRNRLKREITSYLGGKCVYCELRSDNVEIYDCHHLNPKTKSFTIGQLPFSTLLEDIKDELDKCVLLCANCHRQVTSGNIILDLCLQR